VDVFADVTSALSDIVIVPTPQEVIAPPLADLIVPPLMFRAPVLIWYIVNAEVEESFPPVIFKLAVLLILKAEPPGVVLETFAELFIEMLFDSVMTPFPFTPPVIFPVMVTTPPFGQLVVVNTNDVVLPDNLTVSLSPSPNCIIHASDIDKSPLIAAKAAIGDPFPALPTTEPLFFTINVPKVVDVALPVII
jgi:hypothetical protein